MENVWLLQRFLWVCTRSLFQFSLSVQRIWKPFASIQLISACHAVFRMDCYIAWTAVYPVMQQTFVVSKDATAGVHLSKMNAWISCFFHTLSAEQRNFKEHFSEIIKNTRKWKEHPCQDRWPVTQFSVFFLFVFSTKILGVVQNLLEQLNPLNLFIMINAHWASSWSSPHLSVHDSLLSHISSNSRGNH